MSRHTCNRAQPAGTKTRTGRTSRSTRRMRVGGDRWAPGRRLVTRLGERRARVPEGWRLRARMASRRSTACAWPRAVAVAICGTTARSAECELAPKCWPFHCHTATPALGGDTPAGAAAGSLAGRTSGCKQGRVLQCVIQVHTWRDSSSSQGMAVLIAFVLVSLSDERAMNRRGKLDVAAFRGLIAMVHGAARSCASRRR